MAIIACITWKRGSKLPYARSKDGINLHYRIHDCTDEWKNAPYLILQHGYARSSKFWNRMVPYLCRWYKVICPDLRGLGESSKDFDFDARINVAQYIEDLECIAAHVGAKEFHFGGESLGGIIGFALAAERPRLVRTLSLFTAPLEIDAATQKAFAFGHDSWTDALRTMGSHGWSLEGKRSGRSSFPADDDPGHIEWYSAEMGKSDVNVLIAMAKLASKVDARPFLKRIEAPVLGLYPAAGAVTSQDQLAQIRRDIRNIKIVHLPGPYHLVQSLQPAACAEQVLHFLALHDGHICHE